MRIYKGGEMEERKKHSRYSSYIFSLNLRKNNMRKVQKYPEMHRREIRHDRLCPALSGGHVTSLIELGDQSGIRLEEKVSFFSSSFCRTVNQRIWIILVFYYYYYYCWFIMHNYQSLFSPFFCKRIKLISEMC